jgi:hypothetical protein
VGRMAREFLIRWANYDHSRTVRLTLAGPAVLRIILACWWDDAKSKGLTFSPVIMLGFKLTMEEKERIRASHGSKTPLKNKGDAEAGVC